VLFVRKFSLPAYEEWQVDLRQRTFEDSIF